MIRWKSSSESRCLDVRGYVRQVSGKKDKYRGDVRDWTEVFLELEEELEVVMKGGWEVRKGEVLRT